MNAQSVTKLELLRTVEQLCYQIAHHLLGNEQDAISASQQALVELYRLPVFAAAADEERRLIARKTATRCALQLAGQRLVSRTTQKAATAGLL